MTCSPHFATPQKRQSKKARKDKDIGQFDQSKKRGDGHHGVHWVCPPGYFLTDLVTFVTTHGSIEVIEAVAAIGCEHWLTSKKHYRGPRKGYIGSKSPHGKLQWLRTPKNYIATGFNNRSGWLTDQIQIFSQRYKK